MTRGSQVARVQAVVCTVVSAQVFKEPDMHIDRRGEALVAHSYDLGCVRSYRSYRYVVWYATQGEGITCSPHVHIYCVDVHIVFLLYCSTATLLW